MFAVQEIVLDIDEGLAVRLLPVLFAERDAADVFLKGLIAHRQRRGDALVDGLQAYEIVQVPPRPVSPWRRASAAAVGANGY